MSNLVVVDDREIRKNAFSRVDRLLKKLQRMESNLELYHSRDQRLFTDWYNLTFRSTVGAIDELRAAYRDLAEFHNQMHALAEMEDLSLAHAAVIIREEQRIFETGSAEDRAEVSQRRRMREDYIENIQTRANRRKFDDEDERPHRAQAPDAADIDELEVVESLSNEELEDWCADSEVAFVMVGKALRLASFTGNYDLFFRMWDVLHPKVQKDFSRQFEKAGGESLFAMIEQLRDKYQDDSGEKQQRLFDEDDEATPAPEAKRMNKAEETFKLLYRQLARKLHPDMNAADEGKDKTGHDWRKSMWLRVQAAYQEDDHNQMTRLYHLVLLRGKEFNDLRISDLQQTHEWLAQEIGQTEQHLKGLRRSPAWGFSRRKNFAPIETKLGKQLDKQKRALENQVLDLRLHHQYLERLGRADGAKARQRSRRR